MQSVYLWAGQVHMIHHIDSDDFKNIEKGEVQLTEKVNNNEEIIKGNEYITGNKHDPILYNNRRQISAMVKPLSPQTILARVGFTYTNTSLGKCSFHVSPWPTRTDTLVTVQGLWLYQGH